MRYTEGKVQLYSIFKLWNVLYLRVGIKYQVSGTQRLPVIGTLSRRCIIPYMRGNMDGDMSRFLLTINIQVVTEHHWYYSCSFDITSPQISLVNIVPYKMSINQVSHRQTSISLINFSGNFDISMLSYYSLQHPCVETFACVYKYFSCSNIIINPLTYNN